MMIKEAAQNISEGASNAAISWIESGKLPDSVIRAGIRRLNRQRLEDIGASDIELADDAINAFVTQMKSSEIAPVPHLANEQHYEVPAEFFNQVLGPNGKYSCCYWGNGAETLLQAETDALEISCNRACIEDGMDVLDLGCGWGSLSLWIAEQFPACRVTSVSNSTPQRHWIESRAKERGLNNIRVITCDMNDFQAERTFDRIVSVEMFEHMRNYEKLFGRVASWLKPDGRFFMHIFCHRSVPYEFEDNGPSDWMGRHFFSGGIMPSAELPLRFQRDLSLIQRDSWNGTHYERTANAWLQQIDERREQVLPLLASTYGAANAEQWFQRWRIFFMACAELFGLSNGSEWYVSHYVFQRAQQAVACGE